MKKGQQQARKEIAYGTEKSTDALHHVDHRRYIKHFIYDNEMNTTLQWKGE
ncbi:hypothetical protein MKC66_16640 [[Clostridium] innocuum]|uniref:hypothetical protein n=1 Tax=Clostridium innocuum TaxID=1522 RepID=UPI0002F8F859|nr:hypothetical protein [[Clostridium] innocuum]MBV4069602.1 hypothetical protein [[Clostridium] innocuum]MCR0174988.1 hypothetical protein [[Clostridium] innocuum]MCR0206345.1 hypothetical protein [[Clostridium] innocuum]MCR0243396.1 hypothetical protein [[Clostridium] innocuum]